jgi:hypothetical protein
MSPEKIKELMHYYARALQVDPVRGDPAALNRDKDADMRHLVWMCGQVIEFVNTQRMAKANRWIGFIQGVMWSYGVMTIDQMRQHNKPEGEAFKGRDEQ